MRFKLLFIGAFLLGSLAWAGSIDVAVDGSGTVSVVQDGSGTLHFGQTAEEPGNGLVGTDVVDSNNSGRVNNVFYYSSFTVSSAGYVNYCHVNIGEIGSTGVTIGLYDNSGTILASANEGTVGVAGQADWVNIQLDSQIELSAGTDYIIGYVTQDTSHRNSKDDALTGSYRRADSMTYGTSLSNFDPATPDTFDVADTAFSVICNNAAGDP